MVAMRIDYEDPKEVTMTTGEKLFNIPYSATMLIAGIFLCVKLFFKNRPKDIDETIDLAFYIHKLIKDEMTSNSWMRFLINAWAWIKFIQYIVNKISS